MKTVYFLQRSMKRSGMRSEIMERSGIIYT